MQSAIAELITIEAEPVPELRSPSHWVRLQTEASAVTGCEVVAREASGAHWIGKLISRAGDPFVEIELLGVPVDFPSKLFEPGDVRVSLLPPHRWAERRAVAERQRRGEPAAVRAARLPRVGAEKTDGPSSRF